MNRFLKTLVAAAAAGGTAVLLARLLRPSPSPPSETHDAPLMDADAFTDDEQRMLLAELGAYTGGENA